MNDTDLDSEQASRAVLPRWDLLVGFVLIHALVAALGAVCFQFLGDEDFVGSWQFFLFGVPGLVHWADGRWTTSSAVAAAVSFAIAWLALRNLLRRRTGSAWLAVVGSALVWSASAFVAMFSYLSI